MIINKPRQPDRTCPSRRCTSEANIHGNEIQGGEVCLYTIWYLMEHYGKIDANHAPGRPARVLHRADDQPRRPRLLHEGPGGNARTGHLPVDDDNDYQFDEDGPEDLNGNGVIEQIRSTSPARARTAGTPTTRRVLEPVRPGEAGDYVLLGQEGVDHDGDGRVGEDGPGSYDPNRNYRPTGSPPTCRAAPWTTRSSCPRRRRSTRSCSRTERGGPPDLPTTAAA